MAAARGAQLLAGELGTTAHVEQAKFGIIEPRADLIRADPSHPARVSWLETRRRRVDSAALERPTFRLPFLDPAVEQRDALVAVVRQDVPEPRRVQVPTVGIRQHGLLVRDPHAP